MIQNYFDKMSPKFIFLLFGLLVIVSADANSTEKPTLRGVTILYPPFIGYYNGHFEGFLVDLMDRISEKVGFNYQLYLSPDGAYGPGPNGTLNGIIGEVNQTKADFALADLIISGNRKPFVDFTTLFMNSHLAILINKAYAKGIATFEGLIDYNNQQKDNSSQIAIGLLGSGTTFIELSTTNDRVGKSLFQYAMQDKANLVKTVDEGVKRAEKSRFGMIMTANAAEHIANYRCNLTVLYDNRYLVEYEYGIALPKGSKWLEPFNRAIRELIDDGSIGKMRKSNWIDHCAKSGGGSIGAVGNNILGQLFWITVLHFVILWLY